MINQRAAIHFVVPRWRGQRATEIFAAFKTAIDGARFAFVC
jgi:hypothetical protein